MTNYDVIEAYTEDFSKKPWNNKTEKYVGNLTSKTLTVTEVIVRSALIYTNIKPYNFKVRITGLINNQKVIFGDDTSQYRALIIDKDGIYDINWEDNHKAYCIWIDFIGECDITITQLPTSILKDFSGNKHDAYLLSTKSYNKFHIVKKKADNWFGFTIGIPKNNYYNQSYKLKFNINKKIDDIKFSIVSTDGNLITTAAYSVYINDGSIIDVPIISEEIFNNKEETNIYYDFGTNKDIEIDVELIANYPNQLCYDDKSYAVAYGLPILTDYTIIADRTWFKDKVKSWSYFIDKSKAFVFERTNNGNNFSAKSFAAETSINIEENNVSYQTKTSYNGNIINYHSDQSDNDDRLVIGSTKDLLGYQCFIGCHGDILLFNRTLTEYEISWVKNNMMCSKQQEPDIDL